MKETPVVGPPRQEARPDREMAMTGSVESDSALVTRPARRPWQRRPARLVGFPVVFLAVFPFVSCARPCLWLHKGRSWAGPGLT